MIRWDLEDREADFIGTVLGALPTGQTAQAGMLHLLPKLQQQATESVEREKAEAMLAAAGVEQALS